MTKKEKKDQQESISEKPEEAVRVEIEREDAEESKDKEDKMVTIPLADYAAQLEELDDLKLKADEFSDGWQRERAEFTNYRKRMARDLDVQKADYKVDIIKKYLAVKDDLDRALKNLPENLREEPWLNGIELIGKKLTTLLNSEGIESIPAEGLAFDPRIHEAISNEENEDVESGFIIEVVQQGYKLGDRVIRPALVRVSK